jgi:hypothetical protein
MAVRDVHDAVHHGQQRIHVVGGKEHRDLVFAGQLAEHRHDLLLAAQVEVGQRLVKQEKLRPGDQRVRDQHALLLAAGQLADPRVGVSVRTDIGQCRLDQLPALPRRPVPPGEGEPEPVPVKAQRHHVAGAQRHIGVDDKLLRYVPDGLPVDEHSSARRLDEAEDDAEQRGLAGPVRSDDPGEIALLERERDVAEHLAPAEPHAHALKPQQARTVHTVRVRTVHCRLFVWLGGRILQFCIPLGKLLTSSGRNWSIRRGSRPPGRRHCHGGPHSCSVDTLPATAWRRSCTSARIQV